MTPRTRAALDDLASSADACEQADRMILAHAIRRAVRTIEAELAPKLADQEDDGDPELVGERIDPAVFGCDDVTVGFGGVELHCILGRGHSTWHESEAGTKWRTLAAPVVFDERPELMRPVGPPVGLCMCSLCVWRRAGLPA